MEGSSFNPNSSLINEPWNMWIFFALNTINLVATVFKICMAIISLEKFWNFSEQELYWFDELKLYVWDQEARYELELEAYLDILKCVFIVANYFVYW
jgi:hypothetical protein